MWEEEVSYGIVNAIRDLRYIGRRVDLPMAWSLPSPDIFPDTSFGGVYRQLPLFLK